MVPVVFGTYHNSQVLDVPTESGWGKSAEGRDKVGIVIVEKDQELGFLMLISRPQTREMSRTSWTRRRQVVRSSGVKNAKS